MKFVNAEPDHAEPTFLRALSETEDAIESKAVEFKKHNGPEKEDQCYYLYKHWFSSSGPDGLFSLLLCAVKKYCFVLTQVCYFNNT